MKKNVSLGRGMFAGIIAGVVAAMICNVYSILYTTFTGNQIDEVINLFTITGSCIISCTMGGMIYFFIDRFFGNVDKFFRIGALALTIASLGSAFADELPNGMAPPDWFPFLSIPLHILAGLCALYVIPRFAK